MDNQKKNSEKQKRVLFSFLINAVMLVALFLLFEPCFDTNDDVAMCNMIDGSKGSCDVHLVFINCLIGYLLKYLYMTFAVVPWYSVLQYSIIYLSLTALTYIMWERIKAPYCRSAFIVLLAGGAYEGYISLQFSKTAAIAAITGLYIAYPRFRINTMGNRTDAVIWHQEISDDKEHLYVMKPKTFNVQEFFGPLDRMPYGHIANRCTLGGWTAYTSSDRAVLSSYHVRNPFAEIVNSDTIYLIDDDINATMAYIRKWYAPNAKEKLVKTLNDQCSVYQIVEK